MFDEYKDMVTIDDLCEMLNIGKTVAYRLLQKGELQSFKIGRIWKISKLAVIDFVTRNSGIFNQ